MTETYTYDGDGVRFSRQVGTGPVTRYVSDINASLPVTIDDGSRKYVWGIGLAYAVSGSAIEVYHTDRLGSVRAITDAAGIVTATWRTDEFGIPTSTTGTSTQPFGFTGEPRDASGLSYLRARYYDPTLGRFMSRDTFGGVGCQPQGLNRYTYSLNNPLTRVDPSGHDSRVKRPGPMPGPPPLDPLCGGIYNEITQRIQTIASKYSDFVRDTFGMASGGTGPGGSTYQGHVRRYGDLLRGYDKLSTAWRRNNCPGDPPALDPAYRSIPAPDPQPAPGPRVDPTPFFGLSGAALILYLIISEGSRIVIPVRNLVPVP